MSTSSLPRTPHYYDVDAGRFRNEILPAGKPAILKGLVADWPAVAAGRRSDEALVAYLDAMDSGAPVNVLSASANIDGRFFYSPDLRGLNFERDDMRRGVRSGVNVTQVRPNSRTDAANRPIRMSGP